MGAPTHAIVLNDPANLTDTASYTPTQLIACLPAGTCQQVSYDNLRGECPFWKITNFGEKAKLELFFQASDLTSHANFGTSSAPTFAQKF